MILPAPAVVALVLFSTMEPRDVSKLIDEVRVAHQAPGAVAAVVQDGKIVAIGAAGKRSIDGEEPAQVGDVTMIGSCGKSATRLLIGRLADQGKLKLEDTLAALLPDVPMNAAYRDVTLAQIIGHRGGLQPYTEIGPLRTPHLFKLSGAPRERRAAFVAQVLSEEPVAPPGTREEYSNAGYSLLGHVAERVADRPFEELIRAEVFEPLGMRGAYVGVPHQAAERDKTYLRGHVRRPSGYERPQQTPPPLHVFAPAGMMTCTIEDFARLAAALCAAEAGAGDFLSGKTAAAIRELRPGGGMEGVPFFGGEGSYTAAFALWPSRKLAIVVGTNAGDNDGVCAATLEALRAAIDPDAASVPMPLADDGPRPANRPRFGFMLDARSADDVRVREVTPDMPAARAGLKAGDRILAIDGVPFSDIPQEKLRDHLAKPKITLRIERDGQQLDITMAAAE